MVGAVDVAPVPMDGSGECLAVTARSPRVGVEDMGSRVGKSQHLQPGCRPVRGVRSAMNLDDDWTGTWRVSSLDQPGIDGMSVRVRQPVTDRIAAVRLEPIRAIAREPAHCAIFDRVDLRGPAPVTGDHRDPLAGDDDRAANDLTGNERRRLAGHRVEAKGNGPSLV